MAVACPPLRQIHHHIKLIHKDDPDMESLLETARKQSREKQNINKKSKVKHCSICQKDFPVSVYYNHLYR